VRRAHERDLQRIDQQQRQIAQLHNTKGELRAVLIDAHAATDTLAKQSALIHGLKDAAAGTTEGLVTAVQQLGGSVADKEIAATKKRLQADHSADHAEVLLNNWLVQKLLVSVGSKRSDDGAAVPAPAPAAVAPGTVTDV